MPGHLNNFADMYMLSYEYRPFTADLVAVVGRYRLCVVPSSEHVESECRRSNELPFRLLATTSQCLPQIHYEYVYYVCWCCRIPGTGAACVLERYDSLPYVSIEGIF